jgi:hypothetical protein
MSRSSWETLATKFGETIRLRQLIEHSAVRNPFNMAALTAGWFAVRRFAVEGSARSPDRGFPSTTPNPATLSNRRSLPCWQARNVPMPVQVNRVSAPR